MSRPHRPRGRPVLRRDADGATSTAPTWEALTERLITEAQVAGHFDALPERGRRLATDDDGLAGDIALANHVLRNAGLAPPWIEADTEVRARRADIEAALLAAVTVTPRERQRLRGRIEDLVLEHNEAAARLASLAPTSRQHRRRLDRNAILARFREAVSRPPDT